MIIINPYRFGAPPAVDPPLITAQTPGAPRNNFDGSLGFRFTVGGAAITVTALGRWVVAGNAQTHVIRMAIHCSRQFAGAAKWCQS